MFELFMHVLQSVITHDSFRLCFMVLVFITLCWFIRRMI